MAWFMVGVTRKAEAEQLENGFTLTDCGVADNR